MAKESAGKSGSGKRETIAPNGDKRYVRRDEAGRFSESDDVSRSLSQDRKRTAKNDTEPGQGDRGDRKTGTTKKAADGKGTSLAGSAACYFYEEKVASPF